jgi:hypothetical protein
VNWAVAESKRLWPARFAQATTSGDQQFELPEGPRSLLAGDALARALAAEALSGGGPLKPEASWATPWLIEALRDEYPIVRFFAAAGLPTDWNRGRKVDYLNRLECREAIERLGTFLDPSVRRRVTLLSEMMRAKRTDIDIEVGE